MKILVALTYYRPHISGLTIYVERLARTLAQRGHQVTVLTSQYDRQLPRDEVLHGVRVFRVPVWARISKGVLMPTIGYWATKLVREHDVVSLHLPQLDASGIALRGRLMRKPTLLTYHSDLLLPPTPINRLASLVVDFSNHAAGLLSDQLCAYTDDFAQHSRFLSKYLPKVRVITPPVEMPQPTPEAVRAWATQHGLNDNSGPVIGIAARLAAEKGIEYLLQALPKILARYPNIRVLHAGPTAEVIGEADYAHRLAPWFEKYKDRYIFLGTLNMQEMALFFSNCDVNVLPSINSTETFGLVQIEAALCGTPTVASALPGVRIPTKMTGMGLSVPHSDAGALAEGILTVLDNPEQYKREREPIEKMFAPATTAEKYEQLFAELLARKQ